MEDLAQRIGPDQPFQTTGEVLVGVDEDLKQTMG